MAMQEFEVRNLQARHQELVRQAEQDRLVREVLKAEAEESSEEENERRTVNLLDRVAALFL